MFVAGAAIHWLRDKLGIVGDVAKSGELAESVVDNGGVYFVPAFVGLGAPALEPGSATDARGWGKSANDFLMRFQADMLGMRIVRPSDLETTALGAGYLTSLATGYFQSLDQVEQFWRAEKVFQPRMSADRRDGLYSGWKKAIARCRHRL